MATTSTASMSGHQSNKYRWSTHDVPRAWHRSEGEEAPGADLSPPPAESFVIRSLKQGATGAVKTWPACEVLLDYLVRRGGLRNVDDKIGPDADSSSSSSSSRSSDRSGIGILDLTLAPDEKLGSCCHDGSTYNVVELGAGTGCLGVGMSMALNGGVGHGTNRGGGSARPKALIMCTDNDRATIKNMRFNVAQQPRDRNVSKAVRVETLGWGDDVGGETFSEAVRSQFRQKIKGKHSTCTGEPQPDPIRLVTHLVASDVHYGVTTLEPLSSVVSAFKLRNPDIIVVILIKERTGPADVAELTSLIEAKVGCGLEREQQHPTGTGTFRNPRTDLQNFSVTVRDIVHGDISNMKMVEC